MKYIIWDFNGTILDDVDLCLDLLNEMLTEEGHPVVTKKRYLDIFTFPVIDYYKKAGFDFKKSSFEDLAVRFINRYQKKSLSQKLYKNVVDTIKRFKEKGYKNIVLSASKHDNLIEQLKHFKIYDLFDDHLGTKDIYAKSKLDIAKDYFKNNNINPKDVLMIGDTLHDANIARKLGVDVILHINGHQSKNRLKRYSVFSDFNEIIY
ncbi:HAD-IA family hydrolase [Acholeplasma sp. OttesenSCG-928-E16]|nr:HAD-IA family hydrolase [Acholeplasma sp. OttesenSCG-928-E16]